MATVHDVKILSYNGIAGVLWVYVDGDPANRAAMFCATAEEIPAKVEEYAAELAKREETPAAVKAYSKGDLYVALAQLGLWTALEDWMRAQTLPDGVNVLQAFDKYTVLRTDHPLFAEFLTRAKEGLGVTDEQLAEILSACEVEA